MRNITAQHVLPALCGVGFLIGSIVEPVQAKEGAPNPSESVTLENLDLSTKLDLCGAHLTRSADRTLVLQANTQAYSQFFDATASPAKVSALGLCPRWVLDIVVPETASSGCRNCYPAPEVHMGAEPFYGHKLAEGFAVPDESAGKEFCESYRHTIDLFVKHPGDTQFKRLSAYSKLVYVGHWEDGQCRVWANKDGTVHDTSEILALAVPDSGENVYRIVHALEVDDAHRDWRFKVHFEEM